jgi:hypothetical protein
MSIPPHSAGQFIFDKSANTNSPSDLVGFLSIIPTTWLGVVAHSCNSSYLGGRGRRIESSRPAQAKLARPYLKNKI